MIITPEASHHAPRQMIDFYKKSFAHVHAITCSNCGNTIALELSSPLSNDLLGLHPNSQGIIILPVDEKLLSSRVRLDGMIGYQCGAIMQNPEYPKAKEDFDKILADYESNYKKQLVVNKKLSAPIPNYEPPIFMIPENILCGNDTRASEIEEAGSPTGEFHPHEVAAIHETFSAVGWKAPIAHNNNKEYRDTFIAERV